MSDLRQKLRALRPDIEALARGHEAKRSLALRLRAMRKERDLAPVDIAARSGLTMAEIEKIEAPRGPMPADDAVARYVAACEGDD